MWLKDPTPYCASCMRVWNGNPCCDDPIIVDKVKRVAMFIQANKEAQQLMANRYGSTSSKSMRFSICMPEELLRDVQMFLRRQHNEDFLVKKTEGRAFMKEFPQFCACETI
jgi:hypothetical protein